MKTFLVVTLYAAAVGALDLGGAVWTSLTAPRAAKVSTVGGAVSAAPERSR